MPRPATGVRRAALAAAAAALLAVTAGCASIPTSGSVNAGLADAPDQSVDLDVFARGPQDGATQQHMSELVRELDRVMADVQPEEVYLPFPSLHQDHIAVYEAGMRSARLSMSADHWVPNSVLVYDIAVYDVNLYPSDLRWNVFEALTEEHLRECYGFTDRH